MTKTYTVTLSEKGRQLVQRMRLENPCDLGSDEHYEWASWAIKAAYREDTPTDHDIPSAHEGYEWGRQFEKEWNE